ncbi:MAG: sensor histidine kinase [Bryobacteraceae bacterium]
MSRAPAKALPAAMLCEMFMRQSPGCAWLLSRNGVFHEIYGDAVRLFGRGANGNEHNFIEQCDSPARASWTARLARVFAGETIVAEARFGGEHRVFSITLFPVRTAEGEVAFAGGIAHEAPEAGQVLRALETLENGRARLSVLLHDRIAQDLSAAGLQLDLLRMDLTGVAAMVVSPRVDEIQTTLGAIIELVRELNRELNPGVAERVGLRAALEQLAGRLRDGFKGNVRVLANATAQPPPQAAAAMYRIAQEASSQAARRAGCSVIEILLKSLRSGPALEIRDNAPISQETEGDFRTGALEVMMMRYFADRAGIELQIERAPDKGTMVRALCRAERPAS